MAGVLFVAGGILLAAPPPFTEFQGKALIEGSASEVGYGWLLAVFAIVSALTAGAVLRVAGRVFYGWGPSEGPDPRQARAAHERVDETREDRDFTPPLMLVVPGVLLTASVVVGLVPGAVAWVARSAARFADHPAYAHWVLHGHNVRWPPAPPTHVETIDVIIGMLTLVAAFGVAAAGLFGRPLLLRLPRRVRAGGRGAMRRSAGPAFRPHRRLHRLVDDGRRPARRSLPAGAALTGRAGPVGPDGGAASRVWKTPVGAETACDANPGAGPRTAGRRSLLSNCGAGIAHPAGAGVHDRHRPPRRRQRRAAL